MRLPAFLRPTDLQNQAEYRGYLFYVVLLALVVIGLATAIILGLT